MKENVEKKDVLSIDQIKERYTNEWVLLVDLDISERTTVEGGVVVFNSKDRGEVHRSLSKFKGNKAIVFTGKIPEDLGILFTLCHDLPSEAAVDGLLGLNFLKGFDFKVEYSTGTLQFQKIL